MLDSVLYARDLKLNKIIWESELSKFPGTRLHKLINKYGSAKLERALLLIWILGIPQAA